VIDTVVEIKKKASQVVFKSKYCNSSCLKKDNSYGRQIHTSDHMGKQIAKPYFSIFYIIKPIILVFDAKYEFSCVLQR